MNKMKALIALAVLRNPQHTTSWLSKNVEWLQCYSTIGIDRVLWSMEKDNFIISTDSGFGLVYSITSEGVSSIAQFLKNN